MKIFQTVQTQFAIVGIHSSNQLIQKYPFNERILFGFLLFVCSLILHLVYIFCVANGLMEHIVCMCSASGVIIVFTCFTSIVFRKSTLFKCLNDFEKLIDTSFKSPKSTKNFIETNQLVERSSNIVFVLIIKILLQCLMLPRSMVNFIICFVIGSGNDSPQLPLPIWFPFDWNNPIGYLIAVLLEYILIGYQYFVGACTLSLGIGAYWFAISATKEIQDFLHIINDLAQTNKHQTNELMILFSEYVDTHAAIKQIQQDLSTIFQPIIMLLFTWSLLAISGAMLIIQVELTYHENIMILLLPVINGILGLVLVFIACEIGERTTNAFDRMNSTLDQFDWYLLSIKIKRMLLMIIANAQQPVTLECFGEIACTREVFKNIIHSAFSYFMVLRQLGD